MRQDKFRRGDVVEVRSPAEILATLDPKGALDGVPFMPEMVDYCGRRLVVDKRAEKICDTIYSYASRKLPDTVLLEDLRCNGSGHDGCQAECRLFWKEAWLRRVNPGGPPTSRTEDDARATLAQLVIRNARFGDGQAAPARSHLSASVGAEPHQVVDTTEIEDRPRAKYQCQATELFRATTPLRTLDLRPYVTEYTSGNVGLVSWLRVVARAAVEEPLRKFGLLPRVPVRGTAKTSVREPALDLQAGDLVRVKSREEIAATLTTEGKNRGLWFDREMLPFCGATYRVRQRVKRFIDERSGEMIELKSDSVTLEGAVCSGEASTQRWFCPRAIYPYWREAWLQRVDTQ